MELRVNSVALITPGQPSIAEQLSRLRCDFNTGISTPAVLTPRSRVIPTETALSFLQKEKVGDGTTQRSGLQERLIPCDK